MLSGGTGPALEGAAPKRRPGERLLPGSVLSARYRLQSILGAGAFGVVWRARHVHLDIDCAVKLFDPPPGADPEETGARFLQEARVMAKLKCPNVAQVFDYGVHEGTPFLVLELLEGKSLRSLLDWLRQRGRHLSPGATAQILQQVAEALDVAHAARVVHRDLKPENIFLAREGDAFATKVLDFGIAKWSIDTAPHLTATATLMGTAHYMCPEQFEDAKHVDHRADLWSLGVIAFECLTGALPFPGDSFLDVAFRVCKEGPRVASQLAVVPAGFDDWFARATAFHREQRFDSALEQARALRASCTEPAARFPALSLAALAEGAGALEGQAVAPLGASAPPLPAARSPLRGSFLPALGRLSTTLPTWPQRAIVAAALSVVALLLVSTFGMNEESDSSTPVADADTRVAPLQATSPPPAADPVHAAPPVVRRVDPLPAAEAPSAEAPAPSGVPESATGLDAVAVQRTVRRYSPAVRQNCWQRALDARAPGTPSSAKVTATITVAASGRVKAVTVSGAPRGYPGLSRCIEAAVKGWQFPRSGAETVTQVPFMFVGQ